MKFKLECFFAFKDIRDYECFEMKAKDPQEALRKAKSKYPSSTNINIKKL